MPTYASIPSRPDIIDIIGLSETRIKGKPLVNIDLLGYCFDHVDLLSNAGKIATYISSKLKFEICKHQHKLFNSETLSLNVHESKRITVIVLALFIVIHPKIEINSESLSLNVHESNRIHTSKLVLFIIIHPKRKYQTFWINLKFVSVT